MPRKKKEKVLAIDPGWNESGYVIGFHNEPRILQAAVVNRRKLSSLPETQAARFWSEWITHLIETHKIDTVIIESPTAYDGAVSRASQASGSLLKLSETVGAMSGTVGAAGATKVIQINPQDWKGSLPKRIVEQRLRRLHGSMRDLEGNPIRSHAIDALGMFYWYQGIYLNSPRASMSYET